jgi:hypothetical protein
MRSGQSAGSAEEDCMMLSVAADDSAKCASRIGLWITDVLGLCSQTWRCAFFDILLAARHIPAFRIVFYAWA